MADIEDIKHDLTVLSKLEKNSKLMVIDGRLGIQPTYPLEAERLTRLWYRTGQNSLQHVQKLVLNAVTVIEDWLQGLMPVVISYMREEQQPIQSVTERNQNGTRLRELHELAELMRSALQGLANLIQHTYKDEHKMVVQYEAVRNRIQATLEIQNQPLEACRQVYLRICQAPISQFSVVLSSAANNGNNNNSFSTTNNSNSVSTTNNNNGPAFSSPASSSSSSPFLLAALSGAAQGPAVPAALAAPAAPAAPAPTLLPPAGSVYTGSSSSASSSAAGSSKKKAAAASSLSGGAASSSSTSSAGIGGVAAPSAMHMDRGGASATASD